MVELPDHKTDRHDQEHLEIYRRGRKDMKLEHAYHVGLEKSVLKQRPIK